MNNLPKSEMTDQIKDFVSLQVKKANPKPKLTVLEEFKRLRKNELQRKIK